MSVGRSRLSRLGAALGVALGLAAVSQPARAVIVERVVAVVGDKAVLLSELRTRARPFLLQINDRLQDPSQRAAAESQMFRELLSKVVDEELEAQAATKAKITVTPDEIDATLRNVSSQQGISVADLLREARLRSGLSEQDYRDELRRQILEGKMLQLRVRGRVRVTEDDLRAMFERTLKEERKRRDYHPAWIVLRLPTGGDATALAERRRLAAELTARARRGEGFAAMARRYSDDAQTRDGGGDLGVRAPAGPATQQAERQVLAPELEQAALALDPGQVADPIEIGGALVILKVMDRAPSRYTTYEAAQQEMMVRVQNEVFDKAKRQWLDELRRHTHVDTRL